MDKLKAILPFLIQRLKEPSTWVGIAVFLGFFGISEETISRITVNGVAIATAAAAVIAIFLPSPASPKPEETPPEPFVDPR